MKTAKPIKLEEISPEAVSLFWSKVDVREDNECWEWTAAKYPKGYGRCDISGKSCRAHRFAYAITNGEIPAGLLVCHTCDNPGCVNPAHLFLGTNKENLEDMVRKGRSARGDRNGLRKHPERRPYGDRNGSRTKPERVARGERHGSRTKPESVPRGERQGLSKLTVDKVREIRALYSQQGMLQKDIAARFGVSQMTVSLIVRKKIWAHVA